MSVTENEVDLPQSHRPRRRDNESRSGRQRIAILVGCRFLSICGALAGGAFLMTTIEAKPKRGPATMFVSVALLSLRPTLANS
jgi:hypothetical protein